MSAGQAEMPPPAEDLLTEFGKSRRALSPSLVLRTSHNAQYHPRAEVLRFETIDIIFWALFVMCVGICCKRLVTK
jgi:hypothetical protein